MTRSTQIKTTLWASIAVSALLLAACAEDGAVKPETAISGDKVPAVPVPIVETASPSDLEQRVDMLERQMLAAQPTLKKMDVIENHFKSLSLDLERINAQYRDAVNPALSPTIEIKPAIMPEKKGKADTVPPPRAESVDTEGHKPLPRTAITKPVAKAVAPAPEKKPEEKKPEAKAIVPAPDVLVVSGVRMGAKTGDTTRIVLDTSIPAEISYDLDNEEHILVVDIPKAAWSASMEGVFKSVPLVSSFKVQTDDTGAHLIVQLKDKAKVVTTARLNPTKDQGHRVYLDLAILK